MNSQLRNALKALLQADSRIDSDKVTVPVGRGSVQLEKLTTYEHTGEIVFELRLTPPLQETGQNVALVDDDDDDDGVFSAKLARLEAKIDGLDSDISTLIDMVRRG